MTNLKIGSGTVKNGTTNADINIPSDVSVGKYPLFVNYDENDKYASSNIGGYIYVGYQTITHCPTVYTWLNNKTNTRLIANMYCGVLPLNFGNCVFKVNGKTQEDTIDVKRGSVTKTVDTSVIPANSSYTTVYSGSLSKNYNPSTSNSANIVYLDNTKYDSTTKLTRVDVNSVACRNGENITLTARVYNSNYATVINDTDIPTGGKVQFTVNGVVIGSDTVDSSGYSSITCDTSNINDGGYDITAEYIPPDAGNGYSDGMGCNSLIITSYIPPTVQPSSNITSAFFNLNSSVSLPISLFDKTGVQITTGRVQLYLDDNLVKVKNGTSPDYKVNLVNGDDTIFQFDIPSSPLPSSVWAYPGEHTIMIKYIDTGNEEYDYYADSAFFIRDNTSLSIENETVDSNNNIIVYSTNQLDDTITVDVADTSNNSNVIDEGVVEISIGDKIT